MGETYFDQQDVQQNKTIVLLTAILQCIPGLAIIFFLPLVACGGSAYGKYYSNQGLLLLLLEIASGIISRIPLIGWIIGGLLGIVTFVFAIINAVNANSGIRKGIPILGEIEIIK